MDYARNYENLTNERAGRLKAFELEAQRAKLKEALRRQKVLKAYKRRF